MAELYARGNCQLNPELGEKITIVYKDKAFQKALSNSYKFQFPERVVIFFEDMQRICAPDYVPTLDDILSARRRTTGVREVSQLYIYINKKYLFFLFFVFFYVYT